MEIPILALRLCAPAEARSSAFVGEEKGLGGSFWAGSVTFLLIEVVAWFFPTSLRVFKCEFSTFPDLGSYVVFDISDLAWIFDRSCTSERREL